jgi:hypothetical protein
MTRMCYGQWSEIFAGITAIVIASFLPIPGYRHWTQQSN